MMAEDPIWDELWAGLKESLDVLVDQLRASNPRLGSLAGHHHTTAFPLYTYVSLCRTAPSTEEDLVLTWRIAWQGDYLVSATEIARSDGTIVAEAAPAELREPVKRGKLFAEQKRAIEFFRSNLDLIRQEVCC